MDIWHKVDFDLFPRTLRELAEFIGEDGVRALARHFRGKKIYIPKSRLQNKLLLQALGEEALRRWSLEQGGLYFEVPLCKAISDQRRNLDIKAKRDEGWSILDLMGHFNLSRATLQLVFSGG